MVKRANDIPPKPAEKDDDQVFDLGAIAPLRKVVLIDGSAYEMLDVNELGIADRSKLAKLVDRITKLENKGERATAKDQQEYDARLLTISKMILPGAPQALIDKLSLGKRGDLVVRFLVETAVESPRLSMVGRLLRGMKPSPGSSGSTAATP